MILTPDADTNDARSRPSRHRGARLIVLPKWVVFADPLTIRAG